MMLRAPRCRDPVEPGRFAGEESGVAFHGQSGRAQRDCLRGRCGPGWASRNSVGAPARLGAALAYAATVTLYVLGNDRTTAANTIFLQYTGPIYVALLSPWVLGERIERRDWFYILVALAGVALFFSGINSARAGSPRHLLRIGQRSGFRNR